MFDGTAERCRAVSHLAEQGLVDEDGEVVEASGAARLAFDQRHFQRTNSQRRHLRCNADAVEIGPVRAVRKGHPAVVTQNLAERNACIEQALVVGFGLSEIRYSDRNVVEPGHRCHSTDRPLPPGLSLPSLISVMHDKHPFRIRSDWNVARCGTHGHNPAMNSFDAAVVGAGPNGLAAAAELTRAGRRVLVIEQADVIGGGTRTEELTLPGFLHDVCSAIHPLGAASPFFESVGIERWIQPDIPMTHPLDGGRVGVLHRSLAETVAGLGPDGRRYRSIIEPLVDKGDALIEQVLGPLSVPTNPITMGRFGALGIAPAATVVRGFESEQVKGLLAGLAAHSIGPLSRMFTSAVAQLFAVTAHTHGWPLMAGGSQQIASQLAEVVVEGGGAIETGRTIESLDELPQVGDVLLDVMPGAAIAISGNRLAPSARRRLERWERGPGVFKVDLALDGPVPWADEFSASAGTVHVGGTFEEVAVSEAEVARGAHPENPFVIVTQQSLFDTSRAPEGSHTLWAYCHVPAGSTVDMTDRIEAQIERFAPGFRDRIVARHTMGPAEFEAHNPNYVGGDIAGGAFTPRKLLQGGRARPYRLGEGLYLCSSATPPGAGVHGMCGYHAARAVITDSR